MAQPHLESDEPTLDQLELLAGSADIRDRAFAASSLMLRRNMVDTPRLGALYESIRRTARAEHAALHDAIGRGQLDAEALHERLQTVAPELRDHFVEELLDVAYPPLPTQPRSSDVTRHSPSGIAELLFMLEHARLGPEQALVDLGCGFGKVVLLTAMLTGARAYGIDLDQRLVDHARGAARRLKLDRVELSAGDICEAPLPEADVYYMFIPFLRSADVVARLEPIAARRRIVLFSQALELGRTPWLRTTGRGCYWLEMYESTT